MELLLHGTNILHKTNTSCYLAKEEATLSVIRLIVVKSAVKASLTLPPTHLVRNYRSGPSICSITSDAPGHWLQNRTEPRRNVLWHHWRRSDGGVGNSSLMKKSYCGIASEKVIKGGRREESCINKIISVSATNIDTKVKTWES